MTEPSCKDAAGVFKPKWFFGESPVGHFGRVGPVGLGSQVDKEICQRTGIKNRNEGLVENRRLWGAQAQEAVCGFGERRCSFLLVLLLKSGNDIRSPSPARATPAKINAIRYKRESKGKLGAPSTRLVRLDLEQARDLSYKGKAAVEAPDFTRKQKGKGKKVAPVADGVERFTMGSTNSARRVESSRQKKMRVPPSAE